ncbi:MAG: hypothetical protein AAGI23_11215 [Bacteroidota bacterium]
MTRVQAFFLVFCYSFTLTIASAQIWEANTFQSETAFQEKIAPMLARIANSRNYLDLSKATSRCPDTGKRVLSWAVEGETIYSPYTGRTYRQGDTGYFGPKDRNVKGEITDFGGDPLKYTLPPAIATLLLNPDEAATKAYLSIPGNWNQQYHFACKNWARFYPLLKDTMGVEWQQGFQNSVSRYAEIKRHEGMTKRLFSEPHTLMGSPRYLLGGNSIDGGTENHKLMWRTSALIYAQLFPKDQRISDMVAPQVEAQTKQLLRDFAQRLLQTGNGEYDSQIYYPHSIEGLLNVYDFSPDEESKAIAKMILDYYFATYALKVFDGAMAGGQKRGYLPKDEPNEMERMNWAYGSPTNRDMSEVVLGIHQTTTTYRPNRVIENLLQGKFDMPFEARISRPFYHLDRKNAFQESFYRSKSFALGNVYQSIQDNPNQQMVWSLLIKGNDRPIGFTGGQPRRLTTSGHSPYTQTAHSKGTIIVLSAPTKTDTIAPKFAVSDARINPWHLPDSAQLDDHEFVNRMHYAKEPLQTIREPKTTEELQAFWDEKLYSAASWLLIPRELKIDEMVDNWLFIKSLETYIAIRTLTDDHFIITADDEQINAVSSKKWKATLEDYHVLVVQGQQSGYTLEVAEQADYRSFEAFQKAIQKKTKLDDKKWATDLQLNYQSLYDDIFDIQYQADQLRCEWSLNGERLDYENWTKNGVYDSPYIKVGNGQMEVTDGKDGYQVEWKGKALIYEER